MNPPSRLTRLARAIVSRSLARPIAGEAAADLIDDYQRVREARGALRAAVWLIGAGLALTGVFVTISLGTLMRSTVIVKRDVIHAVRSMSRSPGSSLGAVAMLAIGLAAVVGAWGLTSALVFQSIGRGTPGELRRIGAADRNGRTLLRFSDVELQTIRNGLSGVTGFSAVYLQPVVVRAADADTQTMVELVDGQYFDLIGIDVTAGRPLMELDAAADAPPVAVISDTFWRDRFSRDSGALGATVRINGHAFTVIGAATPGAAGSFFGGGVDAWITTAHANTVLSRNWRTNPDDRFWTGFARSTPETRSRIDAALSRASRDLAQQLPDPWRERRLVTTPATVLAGDQRRAALSLSLVLSALAALILVTAAANVGGLLLANAAAGQSRAAVLLAIGAGRGGIVRRQVIEGAALGIAAGVVALAIYAWLRQQLAQVSVLPTLSLNFDLPFDGQVVAVTIAIGALTGTLLALGPALWTAGLDVALTLRDGAGRINSGARLSRARRMLVGAQVAISFTLLVGAVVFGRSVAVLSALDVGFPRDGLVAMDFDSEPSVPELSALPVLAREALRRVSAVPGVVAAAMSNRAPVDSSTPTTTVVRPGDEGRTLSDVTFYLATEHYFETVGVAIVGGRAFTAAESDREDDVVIVNQTAARRLFGGGEALDRALVLQPEGRTVRVVGVARDSKYRSLAEPGSAHIYLPTAPGFGRTLLVRTREDPRRSLRDAQRQLDQVGPGVVGFFPRTLHEHLAIDMLPVTATARAATILGSLALLLSAAGLYGIVMWFVEVRRREIGVRVALGASTFAVRRLVVAQAFRAAAPGVAIGLVMSVALMWFAQSQVGGIRAAEPRAIVFGTVALAAIVLAASYLPSRRATQVDPVIVLRDA